MKIALCQINPTVGHFEYNSKKMLEYYRRAVKQGADLVVFPELITTGYPPQDLLWEAGFVEKNIESMISIGRQTTVPMIFGYVRQAGHHLFNSAAIWRDGAQVYNYDKILLPTYDVFDEDRYFRPGNKPGVWSCDHNGKPLKIGIQICEDLWDENYDCKVSQLQREAGAELIINISASPYHEGRLLDRMRLFEEKVSTTKVPFLYCNLVGAQDELIFDGQSMAINADGELLAQGKAFEEEIVLVDLDQPATAQLKTVPREEELYRALCLGVQDYFRKTGHREAVIGLSGGIDSSLVACIATDALGARNVHGISLPSVYSSDHSLSDAGRLSKNLGIDYKVIPIQEIVEVYESTLKPYFARMERDVTEENIQARVRGNLLMALSNKFNWLVLSTGNKTELALGYCTLYGDMSGGLAVISDLSKVDVYALSRWVNKVAGKERIPESCLTKPPSAELAPDQVDPFDYEVVSPLVDALVEERKAPRELIDQGADPETVYHLYHLIRINEYKRRQAALGLRVSPKAFGVGRRIPIVNHFNGKRDR
ncbi:MAG: NAD+ synthase [FCB group bacterium]|nr:NAD+ synthase [FCB group bacterium]